MGFSHTITLWLVLCSSGDEHICISCLTSGSIKWYMAEEIILFNEGVAGFVVTARVESVGEKTNCGL